MNSKAVFLSASLPDPERPPYYSDTDPQAMRDAVLALAQETSIREIPLIYGGHPSITHFIAQWGDKMDRMSHIKLYLSRHFEAKFSPEIKKHFASLHLVDRVVRDENNPFAQINLEASLTHFRQTMIRENKIGLAVFMGGMNGLEDEKELLAEFHPDAVMMPLPYLGGQTRTIFPMNEIAPLVQEAFRQNVSPAGRFADVLDHLWNFPNG
ncbi:MAG: hypothetical protein HQL76_07935 [Magnetococcales bacterium]|nr:hypothetical protein [Magnetococcales bacterium]